MAHTICIDGYMINVSASERMLFAKLAPSRQHDAQEDEEDKENVPPLTIRLDHLESEASEKTRITTDACLWVLEWMRSSKRLCSIKSKAEFQQLVVLAHTLSLNNLLHALETWYVTYIACPRHVAIFGTQLSSMRGWSKSRSTHYDELKPAEDYVFALAHDMKRVCLTLQGLLVLDIEQNGIYGIRGSDAKYTFLKAMGDTKRDISPHIVLDILR